MEPIKFTPESHPDLFKEAYTHAMVGGVLRAVEMGMLQPSNMACMQMLMTYQEFHDSLRRPLWDHVYETFSLDKDKEWELSLDEDLKGFTIEQSGGDEEQAS